MIFRQFRWLLIGCVASFTAVHFQANDWSHRMQTGGQVRAIASLLEIYGIEQHLTNMIEQILRVHIP